MNADLILGTPRRWLVTKVLVTFALFGLLVLSLSARYIGLREAAAPPQPPALASAPATPSGAASAVVVTPQGSSLSTSLVAAEAILKGDRRALATVAAPSVLRLIEDTPRGDAIASAPRIIEPGPTQQTVRIDTRKGHLDLVMAVSKSGWIVTDVDYVAS